MRLYDTARREVVPFEPGPVVTMYTCGITPYDATHLGHAAAYLTYDVLQRRLRDRGHDTKCVRNITDVDDDLLRKARELGVHYLDLAAAETARFDDDMAALDLLPMWSEPRATSAIADIRGFIGMVLDSGHAYESGGAVYFDVSSFPRFGQVSHFDRDEMLELARKHGGNPDDPNKRDPLDFVLWQPSADDEPAWESLWGPGRPGWHIECSALAMRELGTTIDLHGGGTDLIFPHHECEAAQSEAATGEPFVRHWMHQAMVRMDGEKMSKSLGNLVFVSDLRKEWDTRAIRLGVVAHHYRTPWEWDERPHADRREAARRRGSTRGRATPRSRRCGPPRRRPRHPGGGRRHRRGGGRRTGRLAGRGPARRHAPRPTAGRRPAPVDSMHIDGRTRRGTALRRGHEGHRAGVPDELEARASRGSTTCPKSGPAIMCPNHTSVLDSFFLPLALPRRITYVGKAEYMDDWKTKYLFPALGMIPIDRSGGNASQAALDAAQQVLERGELFGIYPEGTRSRSRQAAPGPHRSGPPRPAHGRADHPGRHQGRPRGDAAGREVPEAAAPGDRALRPADQRPPLRGPGRRPHAAAPDHRRGDVRDPRAVRPGVRGRVRHQEGRGDPDRDGHMPDVGSSPSGNGHGHRRSAGAPPTCSAPGPADRARPVARTPSCR